MIHFNKPPRTGNEEKYVLEAMNSLKMSGDGPFGKRCQKWFEERYHCCKTLLTPSCTHALEMAALLLDIQAGDEVIMPSYTFVSTADAFALRGAKIIFVDVRADTMNIDERLIEAAITPKTKAIVPVHYAGVGCDMDTIMDIATRHNLYVVEDAAQGFEATYKGRPLGTIGHLGAFSFHETKNITSGGEGGLLLINDERFSQRAEIIREKGTNRSQFFRGMVDKYGWMDIGSSYLPSELQAAYLWGNLEMIDAIQTHRLNTWKAYFERLEPLAKKGLLELATIPNECVHNAHMFYLKVKNLEERTALLEKFKEASIGAVFHYIPLHSAPAGLKYGHMFQEDIYTTKESERLVRLPMYYGITLEEVDEVCEVLMKWSEC